MASANAAKCLAQLGTNPQGADSMLTFAVVKMLALGGTDGTEPSVVDNVVAQTRAVFGESYVTQRVAYKLNELRGVLNDR